MPKIHLVEKNEAGWQGALPDAVSKVRRARMGFMAARTNGAMTRIMAM